MNVKDINKSATSQLTEQISASYILVFHIKLNNTHGNIKVLLIKEMIKKKKINIRQSNKVSINQSINHQSISNSTTSKTPLQLHPTHDYLQSVSPLLHCQYYIHQPNVGFLTKVVVSLIWRTQ
jgi:hypothetical protein